MTFNSKKRVMNKVEFKKHVVKAGAILAKKGDGLQITSSKGPFYYPFRDNENNAVYLSSALLVRVFNTRNDHYHNVVVSYCKNKGFNFWCGDSFLHGGKTFTDEKVAELATTCIKNIDSESKAEKVYSEIVEHCGIVEKDSYCHFWTQWNANSTPCKHVALVLSEFGSSGTYDTEILIEHYKDAFSSDGLSSAENERPIEESLTHYSFAKHIIIEGQKGSGKTHAVTSFIKGMNAIRFDGHAGVEALDLKGYLIRYADKSGVEKTVWQDGALAQAFRQASQKIPTILFIDEIGRIPANEQSILVSALTKDFEGFYSFNTGRVLNVVDGVATTETLRVRSDLLWVVGTTNVGHEYNVEEFETALKDRFRFIRLETDAKRIKDVLETKSKSMSLTASMSSKLLKLYQRLVKLKNQEKLTHAPNLRHIVEIIELADDESDIVNEVHRTVNLWVGRNIGTGELIKEELGCVNQVIDSVF